MRTVVEEQEVDVVVMVPLRLQDMFKKKIDNSIDF